MGTRLELQALLEQIFVDIGEWLWGGDGYDENDMPDAIQKEAHRHVYFQTPSTLRMSYPCIVYKLDNVNTKYADNLPYAYRKRYTVTVIDKNPDSVIPDRIGSLPLSSFRTKFEKENLNHFVYQLYY